MRQGRSFGVETVLRIGGKQAAPAPTLIPPLSTKKSSPGSCPSPSHLLPPRPRGALARKQQRSRGGRLSLCPPTPLQVTFQRVSIKNSRPPPCAPFFPPRGEGKERGPWRPGSPSIPGAGAPPPASAAPRSAPGGAPAPPPPSPARRWGRQLGKPLPV